MQSRQHQNKDNEAIQDSSLKQKLRPHQMNSGAPLGKLSEVVADHAARIIRVELGGVVHVLARPTELIDDVAGVAHTITESGSGTKEDLQISRDHLDVGERARQLGCRWAARAASNQLGQARLDLQRAAICGTWLVLAVMALECLC